MVLAIGRARRSLVAALAALLLVGVLASAVSTRPAGGTATVASVDSDLLRAAAGPVRVIVQASQGTTSSVERTVRRLGGTVLHELPIVHGFSAQVPGRAVVPLSRTPGVRAVSLDRKVTVQGNTNYSSYPSVYTQSIRATKLAGVTGSGVTVALIDTGVDNLPDLAGRIVPVTDPVTGVVSPCVNLSGTADCTDNYGHGTFIAGIIAGNGAMSAGQYTGVAPQASILSLKIAGADGSADVSNVLAAIQWVVSFQSVYNIRVLNLSLGTTGTQSYHNDPLDYAVEQAWNAGIVVNVAASNNGPNPGTISKPGDDPFVITVGAVDDMGTPGTGDDELPNFSGEGPTAADGLAKPDVVAPGGHIISLRAPGSVVDTQFPTYVNAYYRRGSGTSMATGMVSGAAALLIQANPSWTPNRVKYALMSTAHSDASPNPYAVGAGIIDVNAASTAGPGLANQGVAPSLGLGTLDGSRGTVQVQATTPTGTQVIGGNLTAQLGLFDLNGYLGVWNPLTWPASQWTGGSWYATSWSGGSWYGGSWYGGSWYGQPDGGSWYGGSWYGGSWYGAWQ